MSVLLSCPCCGSDKVHFMTELEVITMVVYNQEIDTNNGWYVICDASLVDGGCGMLSGWAPTKEKATEKWNKRSKK